MIEPLMNIDGGGGGGSLFSGGGGWGLSPDYSALLPTTGSLPAPAPSSNQYGPLPTLPTQLTGTTAGLPGGSVANTTLSYDPSYSTAPVLPTAGGQSPLPTAPTGNFPLAPSATGIGSTTDKQYYAVNPLDPSLTQQMFNLIGGAQPGTMSQLQQMASTGNPTDVGPAWDAMKEAMQRSIQEGQANLRGQFAFGGNLAGSPFGTATADYQSQTAKDLNSILAQLQMQASESATGRMANAQQYLGNLGYGAATTFPPTMQSFQGLGTLQAILMGLPGILQQLGIKLPSGGSGGGGNTQTTPPTIPPGTRLPPATTPTGQPTQQTGVNTNYTWTDPTTGNVYDQQGNLVGTGGWTGNVPSGEVNYGNIPYGGYPWDPSQGIDAGAGYTGAGSEFGPMPGTPGFPAELPQGTQEQSYNWDWGNYDWSQLSAYDPYGGGDFGSYFDYGGGGGGGYGGSGDWGFDAMLYQGF